MAYGYAGVDVLDANSPEGAYVLRRARGRLFVPFVTYQVSQATRWKMGALIDGLARMPDPLPEWAWVAGKLHRSYKEHHDAAQVEMYVVDYIDVFNDLRWQAWLEGWIAAAGYVEPFEQIALSVRLSPTHRDVSQEPSDDPNKRRRE